MGNRNPRANHGLAHLVGGGAGLPTGSRSKYGAVRSRSFDGRSFASKAERDRYHELLQLKAGGEIGELECQPIYHFTIDGQQLAWNGRRLRYSADFRYLDLRSGERVVEDVKGVLTEATRIRLALMAAVHGITVRLVKARR
jgi:hypothetical protein